MQLIIHIDGGSRGNPGPSAAGYTIHDPAAGRDLCEAGVFLGRMTNNQAEYHGLLRAVENALQLGGTEVEIRSDSQLLVFQLQGRYKVKSPALAPLFARARALLDKFRRCRLVYIPREQNARADALANRAMDVRGDVSGGSSGSAPRSRPRPADDEAVETPPAWIAQIRTKGLTCPSPCPARAPFAFTTDTPAGFCIHAARAVLEHIAGRTAPPDAATVLRCPRCGADIDLKLQH